MKHYYMNKTTGEITENHKEAVEWYRENNDVCIFSEDHRLLLTWEH